MKTPEQNEATLHRAVEQAQADRWESEDAEEVTCCDLEDTECRQCGCTIRADEPSTFDVNGDEFCSDKCMEKYNDEN